MPVLLGREDAAAPKKNESNDHAHLRAWSAICWRVVSAIKVHRGRDLLELSRALELSLVANHHSTSRPLLSRVNATDPCTAMSRQPNRVHVDDSIVFQQQYVYKWSETLQL